ncbi:MAG: hypothetical protein Q8R28_15565, partial [Dehalococcoidia bacterium]|nr:hypothetical protein [Dehalococcoidia bacterium]
MAQSGVEGIGAKDSLRQLKTPCGSSEFQMYRDEAADPLALVCLVGKTELRYRIRCIENLHAILKAPTAGCCLSARRIRSAEVENPVGGWYGLKKGLRGRFGMYVPPLMEA